MAALCRSGDELLVPRFFVRTDMAVQPLLEEPCHSLLTFSAFAQGCRKPTKSIGEERYVKSGAA